MAARGQMIPDSTVIKRSVVINGRKTSVSLEDEFWEGLKKVAADRDLAISEIVQEIDDARTRGNLCSAIRIYVLRYYQQLSSWAILPSK